MTNSFVERLTRTLLWKCVAIIALALTALLLFTRDLHAQVVAPQPAGANTLIGIVTDTLNAPIADIEVFISESRRRTRTRADGSFRFDTVAIGTYSVIARGLGFIGKTYKVVVGASGGSVAVQLIRLERVLPAMITTASRGGLSGIIGDTAYRPLANVAVGILGGEGSTRTDSLGKFFIPLKPGSYLVRLERAGFERQLIGATIPATEGRLITAWMRPKSGETDNRIGIALFDMNQRLIREKGIAMKMYTHEDLVTLGLKDLAAILRRSANGALTGDCAASVDTEGDVPAWALAADDIEFIEVYQEHGGVGSGKQRGVTSLSGNPTKFTAKTSSRPSVSKGCGNLAIMIWPRR